MTAVTSQDEIADVYRGLTGCPKCNGGDGVCTIGKGHWGYCREHRIMWMIGSNLFSGWREETEAEQRERYDALGLEEFTRWSEGSA